MEFILVEILGKTMYNSKGEYVPVLFFFNWAQRHEGVLRSGVIAPRIFELGTR
jgi:hypothetical protein